MNVTRWVPVLGGVAGLDVVGVGSAGVWVPRVAGSGGREEKRT